MDWTGLADNLLKIGRARKYGWGKSLKLIISSQELNVYSSTSCILIKPKSRLLHVFFVNNKNYFFPGPC